MKKLAFFVTILVGFYGKTYAQEILLHETFDQMPNWSNVNKHDKATYKIQNGKLVLSGNKIDTHYPLSSSLMDSLKRYNFDIEASFQLIKSSNKTTFGLNFARCASDNFILNKQFEAYIRCRLRDIPKHAFKGKEVNILKISKRDNLILYYINHYLIHVQSSCRLDKIAFNLQKGKIEVDNLKIIIIHETNQSMSIDWHNPITESNYIQTKSDKFNLSFSIKSIKNTVGTEMILIHNGDIIERRYIGNNMTISKDVRLEGGNNTFQVVCIDPYKSKIFDAFVVYQPPKVKNGLGIDFLGENVYQNGNYGAKDMLALKDYWSNNLALYYHFRTRNIIHTIGFQLFESATFVKYNPRFLFLDWFGRKSYDYEDRKYASSLILFSPAVRWGSFDNNTQNVYQLGGSIFNMNVKYKKLEFTLNTFTIYYSSETPQYEDWNIHENRDFEALNLRLFYLF